ncbi:MAG: CDP-alcohol phosphatidyltransferase family protein [Myxococcales bacterium]|nr:CDP-alcohol phosphatidyltransferase family protein [Myxococcales bacterium]
MDNAVRQALVILTENNQRFLSESSESKKRIGGLTLPERLVHQLAQANVTHIHITGVATSSWNTGRLPTSVQLSESPVNTSFQAALQQLDPQRATLIIRADRIYDQRALTAAVRCLPADDRIMAVQSDWPTDVGTGPAWVGILAMGSALVRHVAHTNGLRTPNDSAFQNAANVEAFGELIREIQELRHIDTLWIKPDLWFPAESESHHSGASDFVFRAMGRSTDGLVSRHINRPISRAVSRRIVNGDITANTVSGVVFVIGILASVLTLTMEGWLIALGGLVYNLASILDGVDGELARARFQFSRTGAWWSAAARHIQEIAYVLSIGYVLVLSNGDPTTGILAVGAAGLYALQAIAENVSRLVGSKWTRKMAMFEFPDPEIKPTALVRLGRGIGAVIQRDMRALLLGLLAIGGWISIIPVMGVAVSTIAVLHFMTRLTRDAMRLSQNPIPHEA